MHDSLNSIPANTSVNVEMGVPTKMTIGSMSYFQLCCIFFPTFFSPAQSGQFEQARHGLIKSAEGGQLYRRLQ